MKQKTIELYLSRYLKNNKEQLRYIFNPPKYLKVLATKEKNRMFNFKGYNIEVMNHGDYITIEGIKIIEREMSLKKYLLKQMFEKLKG